MSDVYSELIGQDEVVSQLKAVCESPVHAYLFVGGAGTGKRAAARAFGASLLCDAGGCGECSTCVRVLAENHPDFIVVERKGAAISIDQAREITRQASLSPVEASRKVITLVDFHLVNEAAPALLKTIEEPPVSTVFIVLVEQVPRELVTIASRCATIEFRALSESDVAARLANEGIELDLANELAILAGGNLDRARALVGDPQFRARHEAWSSVPAHLDGTGATAARLAEQLLASVGTVVEPLVIEQAAELDAIEERAKQYGVKEESRKDVLDRHKREQRRLRTDELRFGLATLAAAYRDRLKSESNSTMAKHWLNALTALQESGESLIRNPNETLMIQALLLKLSPRPS